MFKANRWEDRDTHYWPDELTSWKRSRVTPEETIMWKRGGSDGTRSGARDAAAVRDNKESKVTQRRSKPAHGILWVDAVGGFLLQLADRVSLGQAVPDPLVDIPILGDLSRCHAEILRAGDAYVIRPIGPVSVDGNAIQQAAPLVHGAEIGLGPSVRMRFRQPHPLSNTATLTLVTHHRTQPWCDGVILMGESCVLGRGAENHVTCRHWNADVVLSRADDDRFRFRAGEAVEVDGIPASKTGILDWGTRISGRDFAVKLERL
jgi:hypothetical protein